MAGSATSYLLRGSNKQRAQASYGKKDRVTLAGHVCTSGCPVRAFIRLC